MPRPLSSRSSSKLTAEERRLLQQQEELRRREEQLQQELKRLPAKLEKTRSQERERVKIQATMASPAISLGSVRGSRPARGSSKTRRLPAREYQNARIKFVVLCMIFALLLILLLRALPSG